MPTEPVQPHSGRVDDRARRTEASIVAWRAIAAQRRAAWNVQQAQLEAATQAWRERWWRRISLVLGMVAVTVALLTALTATPEPQTAAVLAPRDPVPAARIEWTGPMAAPPVTPVPKAPAVPLRDASIRTWRTASYAWVALEIDTPEPAWLRWRDARGSIALNDMRCFKAGPNGHPCRAGRSHARIQHAIDAGAAPGTWTVEVCTERGCTVVSAFETGSTRESPS